MEEDRKGAGGNACAPRVRKGEGSKNEAIHISGWVARTEAEKRIY
jgi:hypothetical protein